MTGGSGDDTFFAGAGSDTLIGGDGNDTLVANAAGADQFANTPDTLNGGNGNDTIYADSADTISGGAGFDVVLQINDNPMTIDLGATSIEYIQAGFGNDTINAATQTTGVQVYAGGGNDTITGSNFDDFIFAGVGNDTVVGNDGNDVILGDLGSDSLSGGAGNDSIYADNTDSFIDGGSGFDALYIVTSGANSNGMSIDMAATHFEFVADFFGGNDTIDGSGLVGCGGGVRGRWQRHRHGRLGRRLPVGRQRQRCHQWRGRQRRAGGRVGGRYATRWSRVRRALRLGGRWWRRCGRYVRVRSELGHRHRVRLRARHRQAGHDGSAHHVCRPHHHRPTARMRTSPTPATSSPSPTPRVSSPRVISCSSDGTDRVAVAVH